MTKKKKTNQEIAKEVIDGKWGNGIERRNRLTEAGYNYQAVQTIVNALVEGKQQKNEEKVEIKIVGTKVMDVEVDLTQYKGINLIFLSGE